MSTPITEVFGKWVMCLDNQAHYRLRDKFLCETASAESGKPIPVNPLNKTPLPGTMCPKCNDLNRTRWISLYSSKG